MVKYTVLARALEGGLLRKMGVIESDNWKTARQEAMKKYWDDLDGEQMIVASPSQMKKFWACFCRPLF
jgi:hypothetical protein